MRMMTAQYPVGGLVDYRYLRFCSYMQLNLASEASRCSKLYLSLRRIPQRAQWEFIRNLFNRH